MMVRIVVFGFYVHKRHIIDFIVNFCGLNNILYRTVSRGEDLRNSKSLNICKSTVIQDMREGVYPIG